MSTPYAFKLTPSMLTFLWDECPRCFWLQARHGVHPPRTPFPSVFSRYHDILQQYFTGRCPSTLHTSLPRGQCMSRETWVKSVPFDVAGGKVFFHGRLDHLMCFDDGTWGIIDYKTTEIGQVNLRKYARQLHAYAWALENAAPGEVHISPIVRLGLLCLEPVQVTDFTANTAATVELRPLWIEIKRNDAGFRQFLGRVMALLQQHEAPPSREGCPGCTYLARRSEVAEGLHAAHFSTVVQG